MICFLFNGDYIWIRSNLTCPLSTTILVMTAPSSPPPERGRLHRRIHLKINSQH